MSYLLTSLKSWIISIITVVLILTLPVMLLWNWLMPELFGLTEITFFQTLGLSILTNSLTGGFKINNENKYYKQ